MIRTLRVIGKMIMFARGADPDHQAE